MKQDFDTVGSADGPRRSAVKIPPLNYARSRLIRLLPVSAGVGAGFLLLALGAPAALAYQDPQTWEFHIYGGKISWNGGLARVGLTENLDLDGDGTDDAGDGASNDTATFSRSVGFKNDTFLGVRIGYIWGPLIETEFSYDKNNGRAKYAHRLEQFDTDSDSTADPPVPFPDDVRTGIPLRVVTYQVGLQYTPLGKWKTRWQPFVAFGAGYIEANFNPSSGVRQHLSQPADILRVQLKRDNVSWVATYGVGVKYYLNESLAARAEVRGRSSDLFDERRDDTELDLGVSIFVPGVNY